MLYFLTYCMRIYLLPQGYCMVYDGNINIFINVQNFISYLFACGCMQTNIFTKDHSKIFGIRTCPTFVCECRICWLTRSNSSATDLYPVSILPNYIIYIKNIQTKNYTIKLIGKFLRLRKSK